MVELTDLPKDLPNGDNMGSIVTQRLIFGRWSDVLQWPDIVEAPATLEDLGQVVGDIIMKDGKSCFTMYGTENTGLLSINLVGETDGISQECTLSLMHPGLRKKLLGFLRNVKNDDLFFLPQDAEGQFYLFGDKFRPAKLIPGEAGGTQGETSGRKGLTLQFLFRTNGLCVYTGDTLNILKVGSV